MLPAPIDSAWAVLADLGRIADWAPNADHSCALTDPGEGMGAARRVQAGRITLVERVDVWEPPLRIGYTIEGLPARLGAIHNEWRLEASGAATIATLETVVDSGTRPPQQLLARAVCRSLAKASDKMLGGLADYLGSSR